MFIKPLKAIIQTSDILEESLFIVPYFETISVHTCMLNIINV